MSYDPTLFEGTAPYYATYRPPKPAQLFSDIVQQFALDGSGALLDLGCGTGEMALPLARYVERIEAWDPDAAMLYEGRHKAEAANVTNISFELKSSDDLDATLPPFKLVTMGQSFHWMDGRRVLTQLFPVMEPGAGLVIVSGASATDSPQVEATTMKNRVIQMLVEQYLGPKRRAGSGFYAPSQDNYGDLLRAAGFDQVNEKIYNYTLPRTIDEVVGELFSMSWASKLQFGDRADEFESELREALDELAPTGQFQDAIRFSVYTAKKPATK